MQQREHEPEIAGDRRLPREHELDLLLERVVALVDLVVERDDLVAQLDVLRAQRVDDPTDRPRARSRPVSWNPASRASSSPWNSTLIRISP